MKISGLILASLILFSTSARASGSQPTTSGEVQIRTGISLSKLSRKADIVALAQVKDTDYVYTRSFPSEGSAFLKILIAYKPNQPSEEIIEVYETGLHANECYFENPTVFADGRRYLFF